MIDESLQGMNVTIPFDGVQSVAYWLGGALFGMAGMISAFFYWLMRRVETAAKETSAAIAAFTSVAAGQDRLREQIETTQSQNIEIQKEILFELRKLSSKAQ